MGLFTTMSDYPEPLEGDPDAVVTALEVGASMWARGEHNEAVKWLRKAVDEAFEAGLDERGLTLSKSAAAMASLVPPPPSASPGPPSSSPSRAAHPPPVPGEHTHEDAVPAVAAPPEARQSPSATPRALPPRPPSAPPRTRTSRPPGPRVTARAPRGSETSLKAAPKATLPSPGGPSPATRGPEASAAPVESAHAHDAADANSRRTFDPKFISPLGMMRMATPAHPPPVNVPADLAPTAARVPLVDPPQGSTRPALPESLRALPMDSLDLADRGGWTTTTAARVAVSRDGERVVVRRFDGDGLLAGEVEAILVGVPDAAALLEMLALGGRARE
jgi:hypothetical protein